MEKREFVIEYVLNRTKTVDNIQDSASVVRNAERAWKEIERVTTTN